MIAERPSVYEQAFRDLLLAEYPGVSGEYLDQAVEHARCAASARYFIQTYAKLVSPNRETGGHIDWEPWPYLLQLIDAFESNRLVVVLKARQLGVSWLMAAYCLWMAKFHRGARVLILSQGETEAAEVLQRARNIENALPEWLRSARGKSNESVMEFPKKLSRLWAAPATARAGRSESATLVFLDEFAQHEHAEEAYAALKPAVDSNNGQMIVVSTAYGLDNMLHELYAKAGGMKAPNTRTEWFGPVGPNGFAPVFLPWSARPDRDEAWYAEQKASLNPHKLAMEYPSTAEEAFQSSGYLIFDKDALAEMEAVQKEPIPRADYPEMLKGLQSLTLYAPSTGQFRYLMGADVAEGGAKDDASCLMIFDAETFEQVGILHERTSPDVFAQHVDWVATAYPGLVAVEKNNHGMTVNSLLNQFTGGSMVDDGRWVLDPVTPWRPYQLYHHNEPTREPTALFDPRNLRTAGWPTTTRTKPMIIGQAAEFVRKRWMQIHSPLVRAEMRRYAQDENGQMSAPKNEHDDTVMAAAIAIQMRFWLRVDSTPRVRELKIVRDFSRAS